MGGRLHYAWAVVAVGFVALVMSAGFRSTAGVLLIPLHDEFGWSHETIGLAVSLNLLCFGLGAPFAAAFVERFGMRRVVACAALWDQRSFKQVVVRGYSPQLARWRRVINVAGPVFGVPVLPQIGSPLEFVYLSHVAVDDEHAARAAGGLDRSGWHEHRRRSRRLLDPRRCRRALQSRAAAATCPLARR